MPSKTVKKTTPLVETPVSEPVQTTPVVTQEASQPVQTTPVVSQESSQPTKQKGGKKKVDSASVAPVEAVAAVVAAAAAPVVAPVEAAPVEAAPVEVAPLKLPTKRGGAKAKVTPASTDAVVAPPLAAVAAETKPEPKKRVAKAKPVVEESEQTAGKPKVAKKQAVKGKTAPKTPKVAKLVVETDVENDESGDRRIRSFKVKLPDKEDFEGRFTGLTPYQAANKALSKYFRETENPKKEITFLICESTRKSKKSVYTYIGKRYQLDVPVKYTIQDGREIVKNFKNSLKKVKKVDLIGGAPVVAPVVSPVVA